MDNSIANTEFINTNMINELIENVRILKIHYIKQQDVDRAKTAMELEKELIDGIGNLNTIVAFTQTWIKFCENPNNY